MHWRSFIHGTSGNIRRWIIFAGAASALFWFLFLDSHSLASRVKWHREYVVLKAQNERLQRQIDDLEARLERPLTDLEIERIAREQYGMARPGEVVYPVETGK